MCLSCGCNGRHLKADGSCLCGCKALVTAWEAPTRTIFPLEQLKDMQPPAGESVPPSKPAGEAAAPIDEGHE